MDVHFHAHHAEVSAHMRKRAEREVRRAAQRIPRVVEAIVRFEQDGTVRRVSVTLRAPQHHDLVASGDLRLSANQQCWPAQEDMERRIIDAFKREGRP